MVSIRQCLQHASELREVSDTPRLDVELLLAMALAKPRSYLYTWPEQLLTSEQYNVFVQLFERRSRGEPMAYLLGEKEFWSLSLKVDGSTLIPRPETELLVETALSLLPPAHRRVLDLGTGTGAIALALASERTQWTILAADNNPSALRLATENCRRHGFSNVELVRSDWFGGIAAQGFDLIVANPPYIDETDPHLKEGDVRFEPRTALVAEDQGLGDIRSIIRRGWDYLHPGGWLILEHGWQQGDAVRHLMTDSGYARIQTKPDLSRRERVTLGRRPD